MRRVSARSRDPDPDPTADGVATSPIDKDAGTVGPDTTNAPAFSEGTGVADVAVGRERQIAAGLRELGGRARAVGAE
jgi:hypothetical protein